MLLEPSVRGCEFTRENSQRCGPEDELRAKISEPGIVSEIFVQKASLEDFVASQRMRPYGPINHRGVWI
jgi:hypothetical protein